MVLSLMAEVTNSNGTAFASPAWIHPGAALNLPDFLIISPPKTGSTWLATNIRCHPRIFIPAIKEVKYFSTYYRWLGLNWYARYFQSAGGRLKGEASPSYSVLPRRMIQALHALIPEVKLIFLMRDPVARAWSHARHNWHYREANFRKQTETFDTVADEEWHENFRHAWPIASGDYLGQLRRWLSIFPQRQIFVDVFERIQSDPEGLLSAIMDFLGVDPPQDWSSYPTKETILAGAPKAISDELRNDLRLLLQDRTRELKDFLQEQFGLCTENHWVDTFPPDSRRVAQGDGRASWSVPSTGYFENEPDDIRLDELLLENDSAGPRVLEEEFHGHRIVLYRGRFFAVPLPCGEVNYEHINETAGRECGEVLVADSFERAKDAVMHQVVADLRRELALLHAGQEALSRQLAESLSLITTIRDSLTAWQQEQERQLADCQTFVGRVRNSPLFRFRRWLVRWFSKQEAT
jgi:hypothetical protein